MLTEWMKKKKKKNEPIKNWNSDPMIRQQLG